MKQEELGIILSNLRDGLASTLGEQLEAVYLYGSQARGDAEPDSDIDVMIVLRDAFDYFEVIEKVSEITSRLSLEYNTVISCVYVTKNDYLYRRTPLLLNVRREGIGV
jgi:predicted nucleotidyltransferase